MTLSKDQGALKPCPSAGQSYEEREIHTLIGKLSQPNQDRVMELVRSLARAVEYQNWTRPPLAAEPVGQMPEAHKHILDRVVGRCRIAMASDSEMDEFAIVPTMDDAQQLAEAVIWLRDTATALKSELEQVRKKSSARKLQLRDKNARMQKLQADLTEARTIIRDGIEEYHDECWTKKWRQRASAFLAKAKGAV